MVSDRVVVACIILMMCYSEDGGEVVVEVNMLLHQ